MGDERMGDELMGDELTGDKLTGDDLMGDDDLTRDLQEAHGGADVDELHDRLSDDAEREGVLDIAYRTIDSPVGLLLLAVSQLGLLRVAFEREGHDSVLEQLGSQVSPRILRSPKRLDAVAGQLEEYFTARRREFDLALDLRLAQGFRREVLLTLPRISYGNTASYADVARMTGNDKAIRAVGSACAANPIPVVVPCHRVIHADGSAGGYLGGLYNKEVLLVLEHQHAN